VGQGAARSRTAQQQRHRIAGNPVADLLSVTDSRDCAALDHARDERTPVSAESKESQMKILAASVLAVVALGGGQALAATSHQSAPKTLKVVMHDPGCHFFLVHGKRATSASVAGPVRLQNLDEATLKIASRTKLQHVRVGQSIRLARGHYVVMMVGQAADDNYLKLTVR
jgi:hypothetical protein